jgi:branched-chain amino acid transport system permease protein
LGARGAPTGARQNAGGVTGSGRPAMLIVQQVVSGLMLGGIYVMVAVAFTLTIGMLNFLNFTIPPIFMLAGMVAWGLSRHGVPLGFGAVPVHWAVALLLGVLCATVASLVVERFTYRYLKTRYGDATEHAIPLVSSLGFLLIFENLVVIYLGSDPQSFPVPFADANFRFGEIVVAIPQLVSLIASIGLVWGLSSLLRHSRTGRALRSIAENPLAATLMGVNVLRIVPVVFLITGVLCGLAGMIFTINYHDVDAYMGNEVATKAIAAMVIGGLGNIWGAVAGGLLVGLTETLSIQFFGGETVKITVWGFLLAMLLIKPQGLFGHTRIGKGKF